MSFPIFSTTINFFAYRNWVGTVVIFASQTGIGPVLLYEFQNSFIEKGVSHNPHMLPGKPHLSNSLQFSENRKLVRLDPVYCQRKLTTVIYCTKSFILCWKGSRFGKINFGLTKKPSNSIQKLLMTEANLYGNNKIIFNSKILPPSII